MVRLRLCRTAQSRQGDHGCSAEYEKHLLHGSSFESCVFRSPIVQG
jgi:hypothetical protein